MINFIRTIFKNRSLIFELVKRDFSKKYQGSFGGIAWSFLLPLFMLSIYTLAFGVILKARWGFPGGISEYALMIFSGLLIFNAFSEVLSKACTLVTDNPNLVKKVVFPLELLSVVSVITALIHTLIGILVWFIGYAIFFGVPTVTSLLFPLILICFFPILLGTSLALSSLGVMVRDLSQIAGIFNHALLFLTPIFYSIDAAPSTLRAMLLINPLTFLVEQMRIILFFGFPPSVKGLLSYLVLASLFSFLSLALFRRLRPHFADMI